MFSVIIPAYNEESVIKSTIEELKKIFIETGFVDAEIILVDDGSSDKTSEASEKAGAVTIRHPHNIGYGRSLKDGILAAKHDTIVITDADGTYPLEMIPALLKEYKKGFNMVVGARQGENYDESLKKKILRLILKKLVEFTAGRKIPDINSGLRVFSREEILPYFSKLCDTFSFTTSLTLAYMMNGKLLCQDTSVYNRSDSFLQSDKNIHSFLLRITWRSIIKLHTIIYFPFDNYILSWTGVHSVINPYVRSRSYISSA